jgi:beta-lactamase superfamily II metal-dependent hydrolase
MNYEIEFMPVGAATKAGDAIVVRYETKPGYFSLIVIDGGNADSGDAVVKHIHRYYGNDAVIAHAVLTHSDIDHACGFQKIVEQLDVRNVWMHLPWEAAQGSLRFFVNKNFTVQSLERRLWSDFDLISDIYETAISRGMTVQQPFAGAKIGPFAVLSPSKDFYEMLVPQIDRAPEADQSLLEAEGIWIGKSPRVNKAMDSRSPKGDKWVSESWESERLKEGGVTSAPNESSVVLYGDFGDGQKVLLTGDAGHWSLLLSSIFAEESGLPMQQFRFVQVPHHGSRSNVGPAILNRILGPVLPRGSAPKFAAYVSAPVDDEHHPRRMVLNAFTRRGGTVHATQGVAKCHTVGYDFKEGYSRAEPMPFANQVEDYD